MPKGAINSPSMTGLSRARNASWLDSIHYKISSKPMKLNLCPFSFPVDINVYISSSMEGKVSKSVIGLSHQGSPIICIANI